jgi:hypothetical protein
MFIDHCAVMPLYSQTVVMAVRICYWTLPYGWREKGWTFLKSVFQYNILVGTHFNLVIQDLQDRLNNEILKFINHKKNGCSEL